MWLKITLDNDIPWRHIFNFYKWLANVWNLMSRCPDFDEQMCLKKVMSRSPMSKCLITREKNHCDCDRVCHENIKNLSDVKKCSCKKLAKARYEYFTYDKVFSQHILLFWTISLLILMKIPSNICYLRINCWQKRREVDRDTMATVQLEMGDT